MSDLRRIESDAIVAGVHAHTPQAVVYNAATSLRHLLDKGVSPNDPRCLTLLQLANVTRLHLLPHSNDDAARAHDLTARAVHIDLSTATTAAAMGLQNASHLTGAAVNVAAGYQSDSRISSSAASSPNATMKLKLLPKPAQAGVEALCQLVRTDRSVALRPKTTAISAAAAAAVLANSTETPIPVASGRVHKVRTSVRQQLAARRRRALSDIDETGAFITSTDGDNEGTPMHPSNMPGSVPNAYAHDMTVDNTNHFNALTPRRLSVSFADEPQNANSYRNPSQFYSSSLQPHQQQSSTQLDQNQRFVRGVNMPMAVQDNQFAAQQARMRARVISTDRRSRGERGPMSIEKGVMNDTVGTPDDVLEAFMEPDGPSAAQATQTPMNSSGRIRAVLAERERMMIRLIRERKAELAALPLGVTEETRRKAIIESKKLTLLDLQRVVRFRVTAEMKKLFSPSVQESLHVPADHLSRLFRRKNPPIYSYMDGYPRITPFDDVPELPQRHPKTIAQDSLRMARFDMDRMRTMKKQRKQDYLLKLEAHVENFNKAIMETRNARARVMKSLERYFAEKKRIEERKKKMERMERLKLLRSNDEQAYLNLLKNTKNERLLQLVRQTDNYLMQLGAQVEQQRDAADRVLVSDARDKFAEECEKGEVPIDAMRRRRDLYYTVTHAVQEEVHQPSMMIHGTLKGYQVEGLKWMVSLYNNNLNGILADEMGLGKTIQTIALITYLVEVKKNPGPYLIIVPLSTMGNWVRELNLWAPSLEKIEYRGDRHKRNYIRRNQMAGSNFNVLLTTYEFTVKDQAVLSPVKWQYIIIDEGHRMKNANCKLAMTLGVKYKSRNRLLLTGTPLQNNLTELWALLNFLLPSIFSSADTFETWFKQPFETTTLGDSADLEEEERLLVINRLHQVLRPFLLRRLKTDVESQLPQKVEHVINCHMSSWQKVLYDQVRDRIGLATGAHNGSIRSFNNLLMQFKKVCNHPFLFYDGESVEHLPADYLIRTSGKFFLLHHMLPKLKLHGHRTLIFSQMTAALDQLEILLASIGMGYLRLDGGTRSDDRQDLLNLFNAPDSPYFCFLLSTRAGGLGLNLQTADTVIIFDSDWNPMMDLQAQDRAHRIGQTSEVRVYRLISSGTVEENILEQANRKLQVDAQVIQAGQFNNKSTESDRHQMLKSLLRKKNKEGEEVAAIVPTMGELNRIVARSDGEVEEFEQLEEEMKEDGRFKPLLTKKEELPDWVLKPNVEHKDEKQIQRELMDSHGRGRRKRKTVHDADLLTEIEWFKIAEGEMTMEEAFEKREQRKRARKNPKKPKRSKKTVKSNNSDQEEDNESGEESNTKIVEGADATSDLEDADEDKAVEQDDQSEDDSNNIENNDEEKELTVTDNGEIPRNLDRSPKVDEDQTKADIGDQVQKQQSNKSILLRLRLREKSTNQQQQEIERIELEDVSQWKNSKGPSKKRKRAKDEVDSSPVREKTHDEDPNEYDLKSNGFMHENSFEENDIIAPLKIRIKKPSMKRRELERDQMKRKRAKQQSDDVANADQQAEPKKLTIRIPAKAGIASSSRVKEGSSRDSSSCGGDSGSTDGRFGHDGEKHRPQNGMERGGQTDLNKDLNGTDFVDENGLEPFSERPKNISPLDTPDSDVAAASNLITEHGIRRSGRKRKKRVKGSDGEEAEYRTGNRTNGITIKKGYKNDISVEEDEPLSPSGDDHKEKKLVNVRLRIRSSS